MIANHMKQQGYNYTLSVFAPEACVSEMMSATSRELIQMLIGSQLNSVDEAKLYDVLHQEKGSVLANIVQFVEKHFLCRTAEISVQTAKGTHQLGIDFTFFHLQ